MPPTIWPNDYKRQRRPRANEYKIGWESKVTDMIGEESVWFSRESADAQVAQRNREHPEIAHFLIDENDEPVNYTPRCLQDAAEEAATK